MERQTTRRNYARRLYSAPKRVLAFLLATAMILTNIGSDLNVAYAGTAESSVFEIRGTDLVTAIELAIADGNEVEPDDLDFTNGKVEKFDALFFEEGKVYEAYPELDWGRGIDTELRVFVRLPEDADEMYMLTGDEEIIFLYINNSSETVRCSMNITRMDDGEEKVKKTKSVSIRSYESAFGDEEVDIITKPVDPAKPEQDPLATPSTGDKAEVPSDSNTKNESQLPAEDSKEEGNKNEGNVTAPEDNQAGGENSVTEPETPEPETPAPETPAPEAPAETPNDAQEPDKQEPVDSADGEAAASEQGDAAGQEADAAPEKETAPEEDAAAAGKLQAAVSKHYAPVVSTKDEETAAPAKDTAQAPADEEKTGQADEADEPKAEAPKADEPKADETPAEAPPTETLPAEEKPAETPPVEMPPADTLPAETPPTETQPVETPPAGTPDVDDPTADAPTAEAPAPIPGEGEANAPSDETTAPGEVTKPSDATAEEPKTEKPQADTKPSEATPSEGDKTEPASTTDLVGMGYCSTAKATTTTLNKLKALDDFEGYKITYSIDPAASARILDGPRGVEEGEALVFGVKNQIGYAIEGVTANGEALEADSVLDNDDGSQTAWYSVPVIYEEQEVEVAMVETGEHPAFEKTLTMEDGMNIKLYAEEGVLPAGVTAEASVVYGIEGVIKENVEAEAEETGESKEVVKALSYNIDLLDKDGHKLDDQIWSGSVLVTFTGAPIEKNSKEADAVEIMYVETTKEDVAQAEVTADDVVAVEAVAKPVEVAGDESVAAVAFEAEHFSTYTVIFINSKGKTRNITISTYMEDGSELASVGVKEYKFDNGNAVAVKEIASEVVTGIPTGYQFLRATLADDSKAEIKWLRYTENSGGKLQYNTYDYPLSFTWITISNNTAINFIYTDGRVQVDFDLNGAAGADIPSAWGYAGSIITLPDGSGISRPDYELLGWSTEKDSSAVKTEDKGGYAGYYPLGSSYEIPEGGSTLYAAWAQNSGRKNGKIIIAIRKDGIEPPEPSIQDADYYYLTDNDLNNVNLLDYFRPIHTVAGAEKVEEALQPAFYEFVDQNNQKNHYWDASKQYADWYVIKEQRSNQGSEWHIDGVIREHAAVHLDYNRNSAPVGGDYGLEPDGKEFVKGSQVKVSGKNTLTWPGHDFLGWNTQKDGEGDWYYPDDTIVLNENIILYAQWGEKNSVTIYYKAVGSGSVTNKSERLNPETGEANGSTARADTGYKFVGWYEDKDCSNWLSNSLKFVPVKDKDESWINETTYYAKFDVDINQSFNYTIKHVSTSGEDLGSLAAVKKHAEDSVNATAKAISGYTLKETKAEPNVGTFNEETKIYSGTMPNRDLTVTYTYEVDQTQSYDYTVKYVSTSGEDLGSLAAVKKHAEDAVNATSIKIAGYELKEAKAEPQIGTFAADYSYDGLMPNEKLTVTYIYEENGPIMLTYLTEDPTKGTVTLATESIAPATGKPAGSTAKSMDGYVFTHWTNSKGETVGTQAEFVPVKNPETEVYEADTYTAHFTERGDLSYRVEYYYNGTLGNDAVSQDNVKFGAAIPFTTTPREYKDENYIFEHAEGPKTVGHVSADNVLKVYYVLDAVGTETPGTPDGVPDQFQITIKYESNANGSVSGTVSEVHTIREFERDAETGEIRKVGEIKPATPNADVQATANNRYAFDFWNIRGDADKHFSSTDDIRNASFTKDVTFAANFHYVGGGSGSGGGNGGGGNPDGPSSAKPETGGPGVETTITPEDVPLAPLPGGPVGTTVIDDGEIPLIALPKTGQTNVKATLTMMLSGILLALTAMSKKRKEEDS